MYLCSNNAQLLLILYKLRIMNDSTIRDLVACFWLKMFAVNFVFILIFYTNQIKSNL